MAKGKSRSRNRNTKTPAAAALRAPARPAQAEPLGEASEGVSGYPASEPGPLMAGGLDRRVTVRFNAAEFARVEELARREGFTVSLLLRRAMLRALREARILPPL